MITLYHHTKCSKSRAVQALLDDRGCEYAIVYYQENPPTADQIAELVRKGTFSMLDLIRFGDDLAKQLGWSPNESLSDAEWCERLATHPQLLQRPIVETEQAAAIGRPPDNITMLLDEMRA